MKKMLSLLATVCGLCLAIDGYAAAESVQQVQGQAQNAGQGQNGMQAGQDRGYDNYGSYNDGQHYDYNDGQHYGSNGYGSNGYGSNGYGNDQNYGSCANGQCGAGAVDQSQYAAGQEYCCGDVQEHPCGKCYCLYCCYQPCYYNEWHTVCEPKTYRKKCCRYVPKYYDKCCVKYVPQYYTQTCCRYEPCYYYTEECRNVERKVCEKKCKYVPKYYYKEVSQPACQPACCE